MVQGALAGRGSACGRPLHARRARPRRCCARCHARPAGEPRAQPTRLGAQARECNPPHLPCAAPPVTHTRCPRTSASSRAATRSRCGAAIKPGQTRSNERAGAARRPGHTHRLVPGAAYEIWPSELLMSRLSFLCRTLSVCMGCVGTHACPTSFWGGGKGPSAHYSTERRKIKFHTSLYCPGRAGLCQHAAGRDHGQHHRAPQQDLPPHGGGAAAAHPAAAQGEGCVWTPGAQGCASDGADNVMRRAVVLPQRVAPTRSTASFFRHLFALDYRRLQHSTLNTCLPSVPQPAKWGLPQVAEQRPARAACQTSTSPTHAPGKPAVTPPPHHCCRPRPPGRRGRGRRAVQRRHQRGRRGGVVPLGAALPAAADRQDAQHLLLVLRRVCGVGDLLWRAAGAAAGGQDRHRRCANADDRKHALVSADVVSSEAE